MKKNIFLLLLVLYTLKIFSQERKVTVSKSNFDIQVGFLGLWFNNEFKITNKLSFKTELGLESSVFGGKLYNGTNFVMLPVVTFEPRLYYNLDKRKQKERIIKNNSGNYFSLKNSYTSNLFIISSIENIIVNEQITIIPSWGMRRSIYKKIFFETGFGVGFKHLFQLNKKNNKAILDIHLRIGYTF